MLSRILFIISFSILNPNIKASDGTPPLVLPEKAQRKGNKNQVKRMIKTQHYHRLPGLEAKTQGRNTNSENRENGSQEECKHYFLEDGETEIIEYEEGEETKEKKDEDEETEEETEEEETTPCRKRRRDDKEEEKRKKRKTRKTSEPYAPPFPLKVHSS